MQVVNGHCMDTHIKNNCWSLGCSQQYIIYHNISCEHEFPKCHFSKGMATTELKGYF